MCLEVRRTGKGKGNTPIRGTKKVIVHDCCLGESALVSDLKLNMESTMIVVFIFFKKELLIIIIIII